MNAQVLSKDLLSSDVPYLLPILLVAEYWCAVVVELEHKGLHGLPLGGAHSLHRLFGGLAG